MPAPATVSLPDGFALVDEPEEAVSDSASDLLQSQGIYYLTGEISTGSLRSVQEDILFKHISDWTGDIQLVLNSQGGDVYATWALIDLLEWCRFDIRTIGLGQCSSAAASLLACGTHGKRSVTRNTTIMVHGVYVGGMEGNHPQLVANMRGLEHEHRRDITFWIEHSKYDTAEEVQQYFLTGVDQYFTADEALEHGIIDAVIPPRQTSKPRGKNVRGRRRRDVR